LIKLETKDLLEIKNVLSFNSNEINKLRAPKNATKETKELATNLNNIKRQKEINNEFKKLKDKLTGTVAITLAQKKKEQLNEIDDILLKQSKPKIKKPSLSKKKKSKEKDKTNKITEKYLDRLKKDEKTIKLNNDQLIGFGFSLKKI
jgi:hypothetical protein